MGLGVHYNPQTRDKHDFDDKDRQLVLCYVAIDANVVFAKLVIQPVGGWFPVVFLHPYGDNQMSFQIRFSNFQERTQQSLLSDYLCFLFQRKG